MDLCEHIPPFSSQVRADCRRVSLRHFTHQHEDWVLHKSEMPNAPMREMRERENCQEVIYFSSGSSMGISATSTCNVSCIQSMLNENGPIHWGVVCAPWERSSQPRPSARPLYLSKYSFRSSTISATVTPQLRAGLTVNTFHLGKLARVLSALSVRDTFSQGKLICRSLPAFAAGPSHSQRHAAKNASYITFSTMSRDRYAIRERGVEWPPDFTKRPSIDCKSPEKSSIRWKAALHEIDPLDVELASSFMRDDDDLHIPFSAEAEEVEAFIPPGKKLRYLLTEASEGGPPLEPIVLLDERNLDGRRIKGRPNQGPLTARQLYHGLEAPRSGPGESQCSPEDQHISTVRQRHVFSTDPDCWIMCTVAGATPRYQKHAIRSFLDKYLQYKPWIYADIPYEGRSFQLGFHVPYAPMRRSDAPNVDARQFTNGSPLRRFQDVSFLNAEGANTSIYCYEAQISFLMNVKDNSTWDTIRFGDTYFDPLYSRGKLVAKYHEDSQAADGIQEVLDPSLCGRLEHHSDPRHYFLSVLFYTLRYVKPEWQRNVKWVNDCIRDHRRSGHDQTIRPQKRPSARRMPDSCIIERILKVKDLSITLFMILSGLLDAVGTFLASHERMFETELSGHLITSISTLLKELEYLKKILEDNVKHCEVLIHDEQVRLNKESTKAGRDTQSISKIVLPLVVTAGMFSMESHVLPFKSNTGTFIYMLLAVGAIVQLGYDGSRYWNLVLSSFYRIGLSRHIPAICRWLWAFTGTKAPILTPEKQSAPWLTWIYPWRRRSDQSDSPLDPVIEV